MIAVDDAVAAGGEAGELQRRLDRLGAAVAEVHPVQVRDVGEQRFGQRPGQRRRVELGQVGQVRVEHVVQRLPDHRMVPAEREHPEPGQHVEVIGAVVVVQVRALAAHVDLVEPDGVQHPRQLRIEVPRVQVVPLAAALAQHSSRCRTLVDCSADIRPHR